MALALLGASLGSALRAQSLPLGTPPWAVEAPGVARARFSLGVDLSFERQESLRIAAFDQLVEVVDLSSGEESSSRLPGDPDLLNRKFDIVFENTSIKPSLAVALPNAGFFGVGQVYSTLTVGAAAGDVRLDFHDRTEPRDSTSLSGRGALFDTRLDVVTTLCRDCPWYAGTSYRFEKMPSFAVDRSPRFTSQGFTVGRDGVHLEREVREISSRFGYSAPGGRTASFVGLQHRWTDLEVEDRLAYRDAIAETRLASRTRLESQRTLAVAGFDVVLAGGFFTRLETAVDSSDSVVRLSVVYQLSKAEPPPPSGTWVEPASVNLALRELVWPLAALEVSRPDAMGRLLEARGEGLAALIEKNGIALTQLGAKTLDADRVRPLVFVVAADQRFDLDSQLRDARVSPERVSRHVPSIVLRGRRTTVAIVFVSESQAGEGTPGGAFLVLRWQGATPSRVRPEIQYDVSPPDKWDSTRGVSHLVCGDRRKVWKIIYKLQFADGTAEGDEKPVDPSDPHWEACEGGPGHLSRYEIPQVTNAIARQPVVVAGAYLIDRDSKEPSLLETRSLFVE